MVSQLIFEIATKEGYTLKEIAPLHGGDINDVYLCDCVEEKVVIKLNKAARFPELFSKEARGLTELRKCDAFRIPEVLNYGEEGPFAYLMLEYMKPGPVQAWEDFGEKLAMLHRLSQNHFGLYEWNYIGSLKQSNEQESSATDFLINQRLDPQFQLAAQKGYHFPQKEKLYKHIPQLIPDEPPALIHGDLWSGNYLATEMGFALIDPAVSYSMREMDIAMMKLFGGFPESVFEAYQTHFPTEPGLNDRIPLYQLYYILVHVNLFGEDIMSVQSP